MKYLLTAVLAALLVCAPLELSAKHVARHHAARAQTAGCAVGATPPAVGCGISDMAVGGALSATDAIAICQQGTGGCPASSTTWKLNQVPLLPRVLSSFSATPPLTYNNTTGAFGCTPFSSTNLTNGCVPSSSGGTTNFLRADGTWAAPPTASGSGVNAGTINQLGWYAATGSVISGLPVGTNGQVLTTNASGVPTWSAPTGGATTITLAPGLTNPATGGYNTGTQTVTNGGTISPQLFYEAHPAGSYSVLATDGGKLMEATSSGTTTFALPAPGVAGSTGYAFSYNGAGYVLTTPSGQIYGCGPNNTSITVNFDTTLIPTGTNWKCSPSRTQTVITVSYGPGMNLSTAPIPMVRGGLTAGITSIICVPGNLVAATPANIDLYSCPDGAVPPGGTGCVQVTTTTCSAGTAAPGAGKIQALPFTTTTIPAGNNAWVVGSGTAWNTASNLTSSSGLFEMVTYP